MVESLDSGARGQWFDTYLRCVVSMSKDTFTPCKVLVIPRKRWLRPDITEKLLTGMLSINKNKQNVPSYRDRTSVFSLIKKTREARE